MNDAIAPAGPAPIPPRRGPDRLHNVPVQSDSRPRGAQLVAVLAVPLLCVALLPAGAWLDMMAPATGPGTEIAETDGWPWIVIGALLGILAGVVLLRDRGQLFGWVLAASGLFWSLDGFAQSYIHAGLTEDGAWPATTFALWFLNRFGAYLTSVTAALLLVFPTGRFLPGRWTPASWVAVGCLLLSGLAVIVAPAGVTRRSSRVSSPSLRPSTASKSASAATRAAGDSFLSASIASSTGSALGVLRSSDTAASSCSR